MAIQLYNLEGEPLEVIPDGSPIPAGRWTTPTGGAEWQAQQNGQSYTPPTPAPTPTQTPTQNPVQTPTTWAPLIQGGPTPPIQGWEYVGQNGGRTLWRVRDAAQEGNYKQFEFDPATGQVDYNTVRDIPSQAYINGTANPTPTQTGGGGQTTTPTGGGSTTTPTGGGGNGFPSLTGGGMTLEAYLTAHPEVLTTWNSDPGYAQAYGSLENFAKANAKAHGNTQEQIWGTLASGNPTYTPVTGSGGTGGNYSQNQNASQGGQFQTTNTGTSQQQQQSGQTTNTTQAGTQNTQQQTAQQTTNTQALTGGQTANTQQTGTSQQTGTTTEQQTGALSTTGTSTTKPIDTLGFGALLQGQAPSVQASDTARTGFLTDVMQTGGQQFGSQVDQAVRNSLTGSAATGAGDSARARAAGYAGAEVARGNMGQRLAASQQLAGPTGLQSLVSAGNPYLGQTATTAGNQTSTGSTIGTSNLSGTTTGTTNTTGTNYQNTSGTSNTTGTQNTQQQTANAGSSATTGWQNLIGQTSDTSTGTATGQSSQAASGQIPQAQQVSTGGGGGCVMCTAGIELGIWRNKRILRRVVAFKVQKDWPRWRNAAKGYFFLFTPFAKWVMKHPRVARSGLPLVKACVYEELRISGRRLPFKVWPALVHWSWHGFCATVGRLPLSDYIRDEEFIAVAKRHNVFFELGKS